MKINWKSLAASLLTWIAGGGLATVVPDKYKPLALLAPAIVQAIIPSIVHTAPALGTETNSVTVTETTTPPQ
jgi:hypothetical protein